jgi:hypothetical protein
VKTKGQRIIVVLIFVGSLFPFIYKRNVEWQGDDDYLCFWDFAVYSNLQLIPHSFTKAGLLEFGKRTVRPFLNAPHNLMPAMAYGFIYRIMDWLGVPFSAATIHFPIALLAALSCSLFFVLLIESGLTTFLALIGAMLLILSPIFAMANRSPTTSWGASVLFSQVAAVLALHRLCDRRSSKLWAALALLNVVLTDNLFFLALAALAVAFALRDAPIGQTLLSLRTLPRTFWENTRPLRAKGILLPVAFMAAWWVVVTLYAIAANRIGIWRPVTPLFRLSSHTHDTGSLFSYGPIIFHDYLAVLMGEAFLYIFLPTIVLYVLMVRKPITGLAWSFGAVAGLGYGLLFYALTTDTWQKKNLYQIYVLAPFLLVLMLICQALIRERPRFKFVVYGALCLLLVSAGLGQLSYVWHERLCLSSTAYCNWIHGANWPNAGTKAVGYLIRRILDRELAKNPSPPVRLSVYQGNGYVYNGVDCTPFTSLLVFSGLVSNGEYFERRYGVRPVVTAKRINALAEDDLRLHAILDLRQGGEEPGVSRYDVTLNGKGIAALLIRPPVQENTLPPPGTYDLRVLEKKFDAAYHRLGDFFPAACSRREK